MGPKPGPKAEPRTQEDDVIRDRPPDVFRHVGLQRAARRQRQLFDQISDDDRLNRRPRLEPDPRIGFRDRPRGDGEDLVAPTKHDVVGKPRNSPEDPVDLADMDPGVADRLLVRHAVDHDRPYHPSARPASAPIPPTPVDLGNGQNVERVAAQVETPRGLVGLHPRHGFERHLALVVRQCREEDPRLFSLRRGQRQLHLALSGRSAREQPASTIEGIGRHLDGLLRLAIERYLDRKGPRHHRAFVIITGYRHDLDSFFDGSLAPPRAGGGDAKVCPGYLPRR